MNRKNNRVRPDAAGDVWEPADTSIVVRYTKSSQDERDTFYCFAANTLVCSFSSCEMWETSSEIFTYLSY